MKKSTVLKFLGVIIIALGIFAFTEKSVHGMFMNADEIAAKHTDKMTEKLNLTADQVKLITPINLKYANIMVDAHSNQSADLDHHEVIKGFIAEIELILNEYQMSELKELIHKKIHRRHKEMMKNAPHDDETKALVKQQRKEFDQELSADEKKIIADFRTKHGEEIKRRRKHHHNDSSGEHHKENKRHRSMMSDIEPIRKIAANHQEDLKDVLKTIRQSKRIRRTRKRHRDNKECGSHDQAHNAEASNYQEKEHKRKKHHKMMAIHFLIMDPFDNSDEENEPFKVTTFPNPTADQLNIDYEVLEDGFVQVDLLDENGAILKTLFKGNQVIGQHQISIALNEFNGHSYYMVGVITDKGRVTRKVLKTK